MTFCTKVWRIDYMVDFALMSRAIATNPVKGTAEARSPIRKTQF